MTIRATPVKVACRVGNITPTSATFAMATLQDPTVFNWVLNVVGHAVYVSGSNFPVSTIGADAPAGHPFNGAPAAWVADFTVTGLTPFTQYTWITNQQGTIETGTFYTAPADETEDFMFWLSTCDNNGVLLGGHFEGMYPRMKIETQASTLPCLGIMHIDDHHYADWNLLDDTGAGKSGHIHIKALDTDNPAYEYDYVLSYLSYAGMLGHATIAPTADPIRHGRQEDRLWCFQNMGYFPQWGDHEFINEMGWSEDPSVGTWLANGKAAYDAFLAPLQGPTAQNRDTVANHWYMDLGCVRFVVPDGISVGAGDETIGPPHNGLTQLYGNDQIDDCLDRCDSDHEFKIIPTMYSMRYLNGGITQTVNNRGGKNAMFDHILSEYQRFFTAIDPVDGRPKSIADNPKTNGDQGYAVFYQGDYHHAHTYHFMKAAYSGNWPEDFWEIGSGTVNGSINFFSTVVTGGTYDEAYIAYDSGWAGGNSYAATKVEVFGSKVPKQMKISTIDSSGVVLWSKTFLGGNPMALASGTNASLSYVPEVTHGVTPGSPSMQTLRATGRNINPQVNTLQSQEVRSDRQSPSLRHGFNQVVGSPGYELSVASFDDIIEGAMSGTWAAITTGAISLEITILTVALGQLSRTTGDFVADGFVQGMICEISGMTAGANNTSYRVGTVNALVLVLKAVDGGDHAIVAEGPTASVTFEATGEVVDVGTTLRTFTIERSFTDISQFQVFKGCTINSMSMSIQPEAIISGSFDILGMEAVAMAGATIGAPAAAATNDPLAAFDGFIEEDSNQVAVVTGVDFQLQNNRSLEAVVGSKYSPDVFEGTCLITGTLTAFFEDEELFNRFINESISNLHITLNDLNGTDFINLIFPAIKYTGGDMDPPQQGPVPISMPFQCQVDSEFGNMFYIQKSNT
jgi:hypothetical protein